MGCCGKICVLIFAISTCLTAITTLGFVGYYTKPHCSSETSLGSSKGCEDGMAKECPGAYAETRAGAILGVAYASSTECPWRPATYVTGIMALVLVEILVTIIVIAACKGNSLRCAMILVGLLAIILTLVSGGLMVKDLVDGIKFYADNFKGQNIAVFQPLKYIVNIALMVVTFFSTCFTLCCGLGLEKKNRAAVVKVSDSHSSSRNSNFHSVPNTSNVMTTGHNTSGYNNGHNTSMGYNNAPNMSMGQSYNNSGYNQQMRGGYGQQNQHHPRR